LYVEKKIMGKLKVRLKLVTPTPRIEYMVKKSISNQIERAYHAAITRTRIELERIIRGYVLGSPEVNSLRGGPLQYEVGAVDARVAGAINFLIQRLVSTINITYTPFNLAGGRFVSKLEISCFPKTLIDDMLNHPDSRYLTDKGVEIPWMSWLLTIGDRMIVRKYQVNYSAKFNSRTGGATMKQVKSGGWRVPPQFSGTRDNNFITRALDNVGVYISQYLQTEFERAI